MAELSRKRKATLLYRRGSSSHGKSVSSMGSCGEENLTSFEREESYTQHKNGSFMEMDELRSTPKPAINGTLQLSDCPKNSNPQFAMFKSKKETVVEMSDNYESIGSPEGHLHETSCFHKVQVGDIFSPQFSACDVDFHTEAIKNQLYSDARNTCTEKIGSFPSLNDRMVFESSDAFNSELSFKMLHESTPNSEGSQPKTIEDAGFHGHEHINLGTSVLDFCGVGSSIENKSKEKCTKIDEAGDISLDKAINSSQTTTDREGKEYGSDRHPIVEVRSGTSSTAILPFNVKDGNEKQADSLSSSVKMSSKISDAEENWKGTGKLNNRLLTSESQERSGDVRAEDDAEAAQHSNVKSTPSKASESRVGLSNISIKPARKSTLCSRKVAPKIIEKLWEGSLQLSTSINVSAIASFKSGEKAPKLNWSKHVAVKGKVRLEAFEKYIQELPRSRNRALMVTSLCCRAGSSKNGLTGMKEVARDYKEEKKVGFAQLASGVDLYVCPRSDTIITILAKYGFFKGMAAAVEDDQDSLIGCVVWRRNRLSSNPISTKPERKTRTSGELLNSVESSVLQGIETSSPVITRQDSKANHGKGSESSVAGSNVLCMISAATVSDRDMDAESKNSQFTQDSQENHDVNPRSQCSRSSDMDPAISDVRSKILQSGGGSAAESKNIQPMKDDLGVDFSKDAILKLTPIVQDNSCTPISNGQPTLGKPDTSSLEDSIQQLMKVENAISQIMGIKNPVAGAARIQHVQTGSSQILLEAEQKKNKPDDDDLPEFDFGTACGNSQLTVNKLPSCSVKPICQDTLLISKNYLVEGTQNAGGPMLPAPSGMRTMRVSNQRLFPSSVPGGFVLGTLMGTAAANQPGESRPGAPFWPTSEQKGPQCSSLAKRVAATANLNSLNSAATPKFLWDDDDDMPEWHPPDLDQEFQPPLGVTNGPSEISSVHNTRLEKVVIATPGPQFQSRYPVFLQPSLQVQDLPLGLQPDVLVQPQASNMLIPPQTINVSEPIRKGRRHTPGFSPDPSIKLHNVRPVGWRGRRP